VAKKALPLLIAGAMNQIYRNSLGACRLSCGTHNVYCILPTSRYQCRVVAFGDIIPELHSPISPTAPLSAHV
jgi:hypothetical protein